ncbi:MAG TPA: VWA domain-containing protein, partial [Vicinamibacterales bacterium]
MKSLSCLNALGLAVAVVAALDAAPPQAGSAQPPVFRAGANYVRVDVVVTNHDDKPIADLTKDDFEVLDRGRPQTIDTCQLISVPVEHRPLVSQLAAAVPDVATNTPPTPDSRLFVMVIDDLHIVESDIAGVKKIMTEFVEALAPGDEAAVVFTQHSDLSQNVTADRAALMATIERVRVALGFGLDALGRPNTSNLITPDRRMLVAYARESDSVLENVAHALAGSPHSRRAIVYVTDGSIVPTTPQAGARAEFTDFELLQDAYDAARRADVPIYTIDPRGQPLPEDAVRGGIGAIGGYGALAGEKMRAQIAANIVKQEDRLAEVAINTGGRAFTRQSNLQGAVDQIVGENGSLYILGYYPKPFDADGKFHSVTVHVKRPGAHVRARAGYVASSAGPSNANLSETLGAALAAGVDVSAIPLRAVVSPIAPGPKGTSALVAVQVSY